MNINGVLVITEERDNHVCSTGGVCYSDNSLYKVGQLLPPAGAVVQHSLYFHGSLLHQVHVVLSMREHGKTNLTYNQVTNIISV